MRPFLIVQLTLTHWKAETHPFLRFSSAVLLFCAALQSKNKITRKCGDIVRLPALTFAISLHSPSNSSLFLLHTYIHTHSTIRSDVRLQSCLFTSFRSFVLEESHAFCTKRYFVILCCFSRMLVSASDSIQTTY